MKYTYGNILQTSTLQFDGHIREYFVKHSKRVVAFYILPRGGNVRNFIEVYEYGRLIKKISVYSPRNIFLAYMSYYVQYIYILFIHFPRNETVCFINHLPIFFFFNSIVRSFRKLEIIYWVADYWPMNTLIIRIFRRLMRFYHDRSCYTLYVSDRINKVMNKGKICNSNHKKTVMLGIRPPKLTVKKKVKKTIRLCFIGVLIQSQGVDVLLKVLTHNKNIHLTLIGTGDPALVQEYKNFVKKNHIEKQVIFPNTFLYGDDLYKAVKQCDVGIALYRVDPNSVTFYADPAKIKQYAEFGLPVIMTDAADIASYIDTFHAGIVVKQDVQSVLSAIEQLRKKYNFYLSGLQKFNEHFNYQAYFKGKFSFLEV